MTSDEGRVDASCPHRGVKLSINHLTKAQKEVLYAEIVVAKVLGLR